MGIKASLVFLLLISLGLAWCGSDRAVPGTRQVEWS